MKENSAEETLKKMKQSIEKLKNRNEESVLMVEICIQNILCFYDKWEANSGKQYRRRYRSFRRND